ncbi:MAG: hypothetical protein Q8P69_00020 [bacterium]|nr:hypothetical protein [bacterium]
MNKTIIRYCITIFACLAVIYPISVNVGNMSWTLNSFLIFNLFPIFGLLAFTLLWLHAISGAFESWLRKYIDFDQFVQNTSILILVSIILHPLLLLIPVGFNFNQVFTYGEKYIWLAIIGWFLLITYDIAKLLKGKYDFFVKNWTNILIISNIGFLITFFHSLGVGDDLQSGLLRTIWIFYGITAIVAIVYTYGIKKYRANK